MEKGSTRLIFTLVEAYSTALWGTLTCRTARSQKWLFNHDFFSAPESGDNASHEGAAAFRLHIYQSSSGVALHCQREKPKTLYTTIDNHYGVWRLLRSAP